MTRGSRKVILEHLLRTTALSRESSYTEILCASLCAFGETDALCFVEQILSLRVDW